MTLERRTPLSNGSTPLRRTPLARGSKGLQARAPLARTAPIPRTQPAQDARAPRPRKKRRKTGATAETRALIQRRDGGRCVRCGKPGGDLHHRQGRGAGGTRGAASTRINGAAAIVTLCGSGNAAEGCHRDVEAFRVEGQMDGYRLPRNGVQYDPETVPVRTRAGWRLFLNDGTVRRAPRPPEGDAIQAGTPVVAEM